jgi:8-hydroxy-5-deazaflavin:NADPH oxidoreductase
MIECGKVGQALARAFARKDIEVVIASRQAPEALAPIAREIGPKTIPKSVQVALKAEIVILAIPFWEHREIAKAAASWQGKIVIDATNAFGVPLEELDGLPSSVVISRALPRARLVKAFNHLPAGILAQDPNVKGGRRVVFLSSDDESATSSVGALVERLGFAPIGLGKLEEGGSLVQARGRTWTQLVFQNLVKFT